MSPRGWIALALAVAAIATGWLAWDNRRPEAAVTDALRSDYVLYDFEMVSLDDEGNETLTLRAPQLAREPGKESFDIQTPVFLLPDGKGHHWELGAKTAWVSEEGDEVILRGDVLGRSPPDGSMPDTRIATETLSVYPRRDLAQTDASVRLSQPGLTQTGVGMELDTATRNLRLLSQVKTRYEPAAAR